MNEKKYNKIVERNSIKEDSKMNIIISFIVGGLMGLFGQILFCMFTTKYGMIEREAYLYVMITLVLIGSILTGLGFFDKVVSFCKCGLIVPTTGFSHAMTSAAMDYRKEGLVKGIGGNIFKLTGSIIAWGIFSAFLMAMIRGYII